MARMATTVLITDTTSLLASTVSYLDLESYFSNVLPPLQQGGKYHNLYHIAAFISSHCTKKIGTQKVSKIILMNYLIEENLVHVYLVKGPPKP